MVSKKLLVGGQSSSLEQRLAELQAEIDGAGAPQPAPAVVASRGFVPRTEETEKDKEEARAWDRSALLQVKEDDEQVKIYNDLARGPNNGGDRPTRFGLGFGDNGAAPPTGPVKTVGTMRFVSSASAAEPTGAAPSGAAQPASEWTGPHTTPEGNRYWYNTKTKQSQWTDPNVATQPAAVPAAPAAPAEPEWTGPHTTPDGLHKYWYNTRTKQSEWVQPQAAAQLQPVAAQQPYAPTAAHAQHYAAYGAAALPQAPAMPGGAAAAAPPQARKAGCTLLLSGIPPDLQDADVRELFGTYGAVTELVLDRGSYSAGAGPKSGYITFDGAIGAATAAKALDGKTMRQHTLRVKHAEAGDGAAGGPAPGPPLSGTCHPAPGYTPYGNAQPGGPVRQQYYPGAIPGGGAAHRYQPY